MRRRRTHHLVLSRTEAEVCRTLDAPLGLVNVERDDVLLKLDGGTVEFAAEKHAENVGGCESPESESVGRS